MKQFEIPELKIIAFAPKDILTTSDEEPTDATGGGDITTPPDEFPDESES